MTLFAIDAGQTGTKVRVLADAPVELVYPGVRTHEPLVPQLAESVRSAVAATGLAVEVLAVGTSGLTSVEADAALLRDALADLAPARTLLAHDSVTAYLGALGDGQGAVIAVGTGVVTLAVGARSVARVDGWGNIMGDAGSGYWIGREALDAVMRAHDGRGPATALTAIVRARWSDLEEAYIDLQADPHRVRVVASFARHVAEQAATDAVSAEICRAAGAQLALSVSAALRRTGASPRVAATGGVVAAGPVREAFAAALADAVPGVELVEPIGHGIDGAVALASLETGHPLRALVSEA